MSQAWDVKNETEIVSKNLVLCMTSVHILISVLFQLFLITAQYCK